MGTERLKATFKPETYGGYELSYDDIVRLHADIVARLELGSYQGDLLYILRDRITGLYAYISTGYGSCSGCDELESIGSRLSYSDIEATEKAWTELSSLVDSLQPTVWHTAPEMALWLDQHDWRGDWLGGSEEEIRKWIEAEVTPALALAA